MAGVCVSGSHMPAAGSWLEAASLRIVPSFGRELHVDLQRPIFSIGQFGNPDYNVTVPKAKDLEARLQRIEQQLRLFQKVSRFMVRDMSLQEVLQGIVSLVVEFTQCDSCRVRLKLNEGLTGWVARERRLIAISREAYRDPRFKYFGELPEDTFEAFLSAPVIARNRVVGVINVQHRQAHQHTGGEMEVLTTLGEQVGCALSLARMASQMVESYNHAELALAPRGRG